MSIRSSWARQQSHVFWCLLWQTLIDGCCLLVWDTQDRRGLHRVQEEDGGRRQGHVGWFWATESQATWEPRQQNKIVGSFTRNDTNKIFQWEINWYNNWSNITGLLTEMKRLQKVAFDELLPKMALENAFSTSFYNVLMIWITPNFVSLIFFV